MARRKRSGKRGPRHQYSADAVAYIVLRDSKLYRICEIVFSSNELVHATYVAKKLKINPGYAYLLLKKLEKWGVVKGVKDPVNGKLAFRPANTEVAQLIAEEIRKRRAGEVEQTITRHAAIEF